MVEIDEALAEAHVYGEQGGFYMLKVSFSDIELFIEGVRARWASSGVLWVQLPSYKVGRRWIRPFECANNGSFKKLVDRLVTDAVAEYVRSNSLDDRSDVVGVYEPVAEDINFLNSLES